VFSTQHPDNPVPAFLPVLHEHTQLQWEQPNPPFYISCIASYMLNLGYSSYDLAKRLDGQPLQVCAHGFCMQVQVSNVPVPAVC
jgi:hypothetical protein